MIIQLQLLNAFTDEKAGGNPAGVVLNADNLGREEKQEIARRAGFSEVAFVSASTVADYKLEFFTPVRQIAHCGHATIATFSYLRQLGMTGEKSSKETIDGTRQILFDGHLAFMEQQAPVYKNIDAEQQEVLAILGIEERALLPGAPLQIVNTGNSFAIIPIHNQHALRNLVPDYERMAAFSERFGLIGFYAFCIDAMKPGRDATTRMFAPAYGIQEEAATGMAAGPLACYLHDQIGITKSQYLIEQGWFMDKPSPSLLIAKLDLADKAISQLQVGGEGMHTGTIALELKQLQCAS